MSQIADWIAIETRQLLMVITIAGQYEPRGMIAHFSKQNCMEYGYNPPNTIQVYSQILDKNNVIQIRMNNQGFNAEQITQIYIYPDSKNRLKDLI